MGVLTQTQTDYSPANVTTDPLGNRRFVTGIGHIEVLGIWLHAVIRNARRFVFEYVLKKFLGAADKAGVKREVKAFLQAHDLPVGPKERGLINALTRTQEGLIREDIEKAVGGLCANPRFIVRRRKDSSQMINNFKLFLENYRKQRLPEHTKAVEENARRIIQISRSSVEVAVNEEKKEGLRYALSFIEQLSADMREFRKYAQDQYIRTGTTFKNLSAEYSACLQDINAAGEGFNLFRKDAIQNSVNRTFPVLTELLIAEISIEVWREILNIYDGTRDDEGMLVTKGLVQVADELTSRLAAVVREWEEISEKFERDYKASQISVPGFRVTVGNLEKELERNYGSVVGDPLKVSQITAEIVKALNEEFPELKPDEEVYAFLFELAKVPFERKALEVDLEEYLLSHPERLSEFLKTFINFSHIYLGLRHDALVKQGIDLNQNSFIRIFLKDHEKSKLKDVMIEEVGWLHEEHFASSGLPGRIFIVQESHGIPPYGIAKIAGIYRNAYRRLQRDPCQKSVHAVENSTELPEIEVPRANWDRFCEELLAHAVLLGKVETRVSQNGSIFYIYHDNGGEDIKLGNWDTALQQVMKNNQLRSQLHGEISETDRQKKAFENSDHSLLPLEVRGVVERVRNCSSEK